jgi:hypothetical protein
MALLSLLLALAGCLAFYRFTAWEVATNARLIDENKSADDLRAGFHQRRGNIRFLWWLGCTVPAAGVLAFVSVWAGVLAFVAVGALLAGYFIRFFTPRLNLAMKLDYKPEFYASPRSASWPDAAAWQQTRAENPLLPESQLQGYANMRLAQLLTRNWHAALLLSLAAAVGAAWLVIAHF